MGPASPTSPCLLSTMSILLLPSPARSDRLVSDQSRPCKQPPVTILISAPTRPSARTTARSEQVATPSLSPTKPPLFGPPACREFQIPSTNGSMKTEHYRRCSRSMAHRLPRALMTSFSETCAPAPPGRPELMGLIRHGEISILCRPSHTPPHSQTNRSWRSMNGSSKTRTAPVETPARGSLPSPASR